MRPGQIHLKQLRWTDICLSPMDRALIISNAFCHRTVPEHRALMINVSIQIQPENMMQSSVESRGQSFTNRQTPKNPYYFSCDSWSLAQICHSSKTSSQHVHSERTGSQSWSEAGLQNNCRESVSGELLEDNNLKCISSLDFTLCQHVKRTQQSNHRPLRPNCFDRPQG